MSVMSVNFWRQIEMFYMLMVSFDFSNSPKRIKSTGYKIVGLVGLFCFIRNFGLTAGAGRPAPARCGVFVWFFWFWPICKKFKMKIVRHPVFIVCRFDQRRGRRGLEDVDLMRTTIGPKQKKNNKTTASGARFGRGR